MIDAKTKDIALFYMVFAFLKDDIEFESLFSKQELNELNNLAEYLPDDEVTLKEMTEDILKEIAYRLLESKDE